MVPEPDEVVPRIGEEAAEDDRDGVGVVELENEAAPPDAELESGCGIVVAVFGVWDPLDAEADDETVEVVAIEVLS